MSERHAGSPRPLAIPEDELEFQASRSGGPGGQHVNTSSTRVEVRWNVASTRALTDRERALVRVKLASRLDAMGWLRVVSSETRSQTRNKEAALRRLEALVARALIVPKPRKVTQVPKGEKERRLAAKRQRSRLKRDRGSVQDDE
jgi:ribosome-associated protein